jgi:LacI family transcriptional regulator
MVSRSSGTRAQVDPRTRRPASADPPSPQEVALVIETSKAYGRGVLKGISTWLHQRRDWTIAIDERGLDDPAPDWLARWAGQGVITRLGEEALPPEWRGPARPVVFLRRVLAADPLPGVYTDDEAVIRLAVEHLVDRGFRELAFCPVPADWSAARCEAFLREAAGPERRPHVFEQAEGQRGRGRALAAAGGLTGRRTAAAARSAAIEQDRDLLGAWLESLPKPAGIVAAYDVRAVQLLEVCRERGLSVPEDVAVVGIDDDDVLCEIATPALTSVAHNLARIGFEACRLLDERMTGAGRGDEAVVVPPLGVSIRQSSDTLAIADLDIRRALRLIRTRAGDAVGPDDVAAATSITRRALDKKFQKHLGRTIHDEIMRTRLAEARRLLVETDHKLAVVAVRSGFAHSAQLCNLFKAAYGMSPMQYRKGARPWEA